MNTDKDIKGAVQRGAISWGILSALVTSLSLALLDCIIAFLGGGERFGHIIYIFEPLLATFTIALVGCMGVALILGLIIRPIFGLSGHGLAAAACAMVGAALAVHFLSPWLERQMNPAGIIRMALTGFILALIGLAAYLARRAASEDAALSRLLGAAFLGLPLVMLEGSVYIWIQKYMIEGFTNASSILVTLGAVVVIGATLFAILRVKPLRMLKALVLLGTATAVAAPWVVVQFEPEPGADRANPETVGHKPRHVILLSVDTLRASALSCYGQDQAAATPAIDGLAADGVLFQNAISPAPWTLPALTSIMTGIPPNSHKTRFLYSRAQESLRTIPEYFRRTGYYTAGFGNNGFLSPMFNLVQGFDEFQYFPRDSYKLSFGSRTLARFFPEKFRQTARPVDLTDRVTAWLRENHERDFFLWLHYYDPHMPYSPPEEFLPAGDPPPRIGNTFEYQFGFGGRRIEFTRPEMAWVKLLYDAEVRYTDSQINRFIETLKELGIYEDATIIFTSDHGEEFWEHSGLDHGHSLYHELLWVPLIVKTPGSLVGATVDTKVSTMSILPTMLDVAGIEPEPGSLACTSLLPLAEGREQDFVSYPIVSTGVSKVVENQESLYFEDFKYIRSVQTERAELYDRASDPTEQYSIARDNPRHMEAAKTELDAFDEKAVEWGKKQGVEADVQMDLPESTIEMLRGLGYL